MITIPVNVKEMFHMMRDASKMDLTQVLKSAWEMLSKLPGGKKLFSKMVGRMAPYTGTIGAVAEEIRPGYSKVIMRDRKPVRNHLNSVHAIALVNLAEFSTGLAFLFSSPAQSRGILSGISIEYLKKARGTLTAICECEIPATNERREYQVEGKIFNASGELVACAKAKWLLSPIQS